MKLKKYLSFLFLTFSLVGCKTILVDAGYFATPPSSQYLWSKINTNVTEFEVNRLSCIAYQDRTAKYDDHNAKFIFEQCMLDQGYKFTNVRMEGKQNYCAVYKGGPACGSVGQ